MIRPAVDDSRSGAGQPPAPRPGPDHAARPGAADDDDDLAREVTLLELLDRVLDKGVVLTGDITLSVADVDLVYVGLRVLLSSVEAAERAPDLSPGVKTASGTVLQSGYHGR